MPHSDFLPESKHLFQRISKMAGLEFGIRIDHEPYELKRVLEAVSVTSPIGRCPGIEILEEAFPNDADLNGSLRGLENVPRNKRGETIQFSIADLFGEYFPEQGRIVIYDKMCELWARKLGVSSKGLKEVVMVHEVAHAVTHLGSDKKDKGDVEWLLFPELGNLEKSRQARLRSDPEKFAQAYTYFYLTRPHKKRLLGVFRKLSSYQSQTYNVWKEYEGKALRDLNNDLRAVRRREKTISETLEESSSVR